MYSARDMDQVVLPPRGQREDSSLRLSETRAAITSTAGVVYDTIHVLDKFITSQEGTIYYLIHVASRMFPLESYTIRRRYNDFKRFHATLAKYMPPAPTFLFKKQSQPSMIDEDKDELDVSYSTEQTVDSDGSAVYLPPMPHGGLLAIMKPKENLVRDRIEQFNRILQAALDDASSNVAIALRKFIREAPGSRVSSSAHSEASFVSDETPPSPYVSLRDYSVPEISFSQERDARRRAASADRQRLSIAA